MHAQLRNFIDHEFVTKGIFILILLRAVENSADVQDSLIMRKYYHISAIQGLFYANIDDAIILSFRPV